MPNQDSPKISKKDLRKIEDKITKRVMENIGSFVTEKCKEILEKHCVGDSLSVPATSDLNAISISIESLKHELKVLKNSTDHTIGSVSYLAHEYDDFLEKISKISSINESLAKEIKSIECRQFKSEQQLDQLEQYGRRENLEIHGIPVMRHENTNQIIKAVAKSINVELNDSQISTSHRLIQPQSSSSNSQQQAKNHVNRQPPPIIVRFNNRDKRNEIFRRRKLLRRNPEMRSIFASETVTIKENLTTYRKMIYDAANSAKKDLNFKFLWTSQGRIRLRRDSVSEVINVSSLSDLDRIGYSGSGGRVMSKFL